MTIWHSKQDTLSRSGAAEQAPQGRFDWWQAVVRVLGSIEAVRDGRAMYVLLGAFAAAGLAFATAQASMGRGDMPWAIGQGAAALFIAFYGSNAAGLLLMDRALGRPPREVVDAVLDALGVGHRVLITLALVGLAAAALVGVLAGLFWLCRLPIVGPWLYALVVPLTVVSLGLAMMAGAAVVGPLTGPTVWAGASSWQSVRQVARFLRHHVLHAAVMMVGLSLVTGLVGAGTGFVVMAGGRLMAEASVWLTGVDVPPEVLMVGLLGGGLHNINAQVVPAGAVAHIRAAAIGGGVVFSLALVMPTLVYLRGVCEIYLTLRHREEGLPSASGDA